MSQTFGYYASCPVAQTLEQVTGSCLENLTNQNIWDFVAVVSIALSSPDEYERMDDLDDLRDLMDLHHDEDLENALNILSGCERANAAAIVMAFTSIAYATNRY